MQTKARFGARARISAKKKIKGESKQRRLLFLAIAPIRSRFSERCSSFAAQLQIVSRQFDQPLDTADCRIMSHNACNNHRRRQQAAGRGRRIGEGSLARLKQGHRARGQAEADGLGVHVLEDSGVAAYIGVGCGGRGDAAGGEEMQRWRR